MMEAEGKDAGLPTTTTAATALPPANVVFERAPVVPAWHALGWMSFAGLIGSIVLATTGSRGEFGNAAIGATIIAVGIIGVLPFVAHLMTPKRVTLSKAYIVVEFPLSRTLVPYRDITNIELLQENVPRTYTVVQLVVIHRRNAPKIVLRGFEDGEIAVYGELRRHWDGTGQPSPR